MKHPKVVAIGGIGLDFSRLRSEQENAEVSQTVFGAADFHTVQSEIRDEAEVTVQAVAHGFDAGPEQAEELLDLGHFVSFSGIVTFENAGEVREAAKSIPIDRVMVESDSPYFVPVPNRNRRCEPAFVRETPAFIAYLRGISLAEFAGRTTQNAQRFFGLS